MEEWKKFAHMPVHYIEADQAFPDVSQSEPEGLLAFGGDVSPDRLLMAYPKGIFPWYNDGQPVLWWAPHDRCVLHPARMHVSKNMRRYIRQLKFRVKMDTAFNQVVQACGHIGSNRDGGTWLNDALKESLSELHERGIAHSIESWRGGKLVGGLYGVSLGGMFFGESMFASEPDASKVALYHLCQWMLANNMDLIDCQIPNDHLISLGAEMMPENEFYPFLAESVKKTTQKGPWKVMTP